MWAGSFFTSGDFLKSLCVFDFDGTLVDSMSVFADIAGRLIEKFYSIPHAQARQLYLDTSGVPFFEQLETLFPADFRNAECALAFEEEKKQSYFEQPLIEGADEVLKTLKDRGVQIAISSNNYQKLVKQFVQKRGLVCDYVLGYEPDFAKGKPHFDFLKQTLSLDNQDIVFVGDSLKDGEKAMDCSIDFVVKTGTFSKKDFLKNFPKAAVIQSLNELIHVIQ